MMISRSLKLIEYVHATLIFALPVPLLYAVAGFEDPAGAGILYIKCLLAAFPVVVTERAAKRTKSLAMYMIICAAVLAGIGCVTGLLPLVIGQRNRLEAYELCYSIGMLAEALLIAVLRFNDRLRETKHRKDTNPFAVREISFLDKPVPALVWYFVIVYVFGICFNAKGLCDMAFYSSIVYLFLALIYVFFGTTKEYLKMNHRTKSIPKKRLYRVSAAMMTLFGVLLMAAILPAILLAGHRQYTDVRTWFDDVEPVPYEYQSDSEFQGTVSGGADMLLLLSDDETVQEPSEFSNAIFWAIGVVCLVVILYGIFEMIRQVFRDFRDSLDENGDVIEEIKDEESLYKEERLNFRRRRGAESEAEKIKRRYRKTIRKHRKDTPAPYESPAEIEENAGLKDDEQMKLLHEEYEGVRYGKYLHKP